MLARHRTTPPSPHQTSAFAFVCFLMRSHTPIRPLTSPGRDALEGNAPHRRPQTRLDRRLQEVAKAVGGGYCRLQMPLKPAPAVREPVAGRRLGALEPGPSPTSRSKWPSSGHFWYTNFWVPAPSLTPLLLIHPWRDPLRPCNAHPYPEPRSTHHDRVQELGKRRFGARWRAQRASEHTIMQPARSPGAQVEHSAIRERETCRMLRSLGAGGANRL